MGCNLLTNPYLIAIGIPAILILCGAFARKLVRGTQWQVTDFFLGVELSLAALASALVHLFDISKIVVVPPTPATPATSSIAPDVAVVSNQMAATASFLAVTFFLMLWILSIHQDWEKRTNHVRGQVFWLGIACNSVGAGLFASFVLFVKGVQ